MFVFFVAFLIGIIVRGDYSENIRTMGWRMKRYEH